MERFLWIAADIRNAIKAQQLSHSPEWKGKPEWGQLCVALDTLEDSALALSEYERCGLGVSDSERYLRLHGTLQCVQIQQGAIECLEALFLNRVRRRTSRPAWQSMRKLRYLASGHPTQANGEKGSGKRRTMVVRRSLDRDRLELLVFSDTSSTPETISYDLTTALRAYKEEALAAFEAVRDNVLQHANA